VSALSAAAYISHARRGAFCPLLADGYYHPSAAGHQLVAELLLLLLARQISPLLAAAPTPAALAAAAAPSRVRQDGARTRAAEGGYLAGPGRSGNVGPAPAARWLDIPSLVRRPPCLLEAGKTELVDTRRSEARIGEARDGPCAVSEAVTTLLAEPGVRLSARMAWQPQAPVAGEAAGEAEAGKSVELLLAGGAAPPQRTFAARVAERQDRKAMWVLPPCATGVVPLELRLPRAAGRRLRGLSVFAAVSPGGEVVHSLDGRRIAFESATGTFLQRSWGYVASWYLFARDANASAAPPPAVWSMCNRVRPGVRCMGYRCGLEFKMPMRTAAVGWAVAVTSRKRGRDVSN